MARIKASEESNPFESYLTELENMCKDAFETGVTLDDAEKLAARCLQAQLVIARELERSDLDARLKKNGLKTLRAAIYLDEVSKTDKKPSDTMLEQLVTSNELVSKEQTGFDQADARRESLSAYMGIFKDAHIYFRGISKGRYE